MEKNMVHTLWKGMFVGSTMLVPGVSGGSMAMIRYPQPTYLMILGFVLGSVTEFFPGIPRGIEWVICILMLVAGYGIIRLISQAGTEETENR